MKFRCASWIQVYMGLVSVLMKGSERYVNTGWKKQEDSKRFAIFQPRTVSINELNGIGMTTKLCSVQWSIRPLYIPHLLLLSPLAHSEALPKQVRMKRNLVGRITTLYPAEGNAGGWLAHKDLSPLSRLATATLITKNYGFHISQQV